MAVHLSSRRVVLLLAKTPSAILYLYSNQQERIFQNIPASPAPEPIMQYDEWNEAIGRYFFGPEKAGMPVFLTVDPETTSQ